MNGDVIVVATWAEAKSLGARQVDGVLRAADGAMFVTVCSGPTAIHGLRVGEIRWTPAALARPGADRIMEELKRSQLKMRR